MKYALFFVFTMLAAVAFAGDSESHDQCPYHKEHSMAQMNERGDHVMGFSQNKATHHFTLLANGGRISIEANDAGDQETIGQIRMHLSHVAESFGSGDFEMPHEIHQQTPPGVSIMQAQKDAIHYSFEKLDKGGAVKIESQNADALSAIHDFLRFQIEEHKTGDPLEIR
jgi:hypothetical protein